MDKTIKKLKALNKAYIKIKEGLSIIQQTFPRTGDLDTYIWRMEKAFHDLNRTILAQLKKENIDEEFKKIIERLI